VLSDVLVAESRTAEVEGRRSEVHYKCTLVLRRKGASLLFLKGGFYCLSDIEVTRRELVNNVPLYLLS
jgi:hypothetical protein